MEERRKTYEERILHFYHHGFSAHLARVQGLSTLIAEESSQSYTFRKSLADQLGGDKYTLLQRERIRKTLEEVEVISLNKIEYYALLQRQCLQEWKAEMNAHIDSLTNLEEE